MKTDDELVDGIIEKFRPKEEPDDLALLWWIEVKIMAKEILRLQRAIGPTCAQCDRPVTDENWCIACQDYHHYNCIEMVNIDGKPRRKKIL